MRRLLLLLLPVVPLPATAQVPLPATAQATYELVWMDRHGVVSELDTTWHFHLTFFGANGGWALSPDGSRLAIGLNTDTGDNIWVKNLTTGSLACLTSHSDYADFRPRWLPDGRTVMFERANSYSARVYKHSADGAGADTLVLELTRGIYEAQLSPDGKWLVARTGGMENVVGGRKIVEIRVGLDRDALPVAPHSELDEAALALSPDGRWLAYESNESGKTEVYVRPFPDGKAGSWQVSKGGGAAPLWARNGHELFYLSVSREMIGVPVASGASLKLGVQKALFRLPNDIYPLSSHENYTPYDVTMDGRFIMARRVR